VSDLHVSREESIRCKKMVMRTLLVQAGYDSSGLLTLSALLFGGQIRQITGAEMVDLPILARSSISRI
jgi:hypothetical protein